MEIISFQKALERADYLVNKPKLLLGNGFSMDFDKNIFSYKSLIETIKSSITNKRLLKVFNVIPISNIESILRYLKNMGNLLSIYLKHDNVKAVIDDVRNDIDQLKKELVETIANTHPIKNSITKEQYEYCSHFISHFDFIYTLNYDLLLYWVILKNPSKLGFEDGFRYSSDKLYWPDKEERTNLYYLHGALHLSQNGERVIKYRWNGNSLISQILENFEKNSFPLIVSGGSYADKMNLIHSSPYLTAALDSISCCKDVLFTHGVSFSGNDWHIMEAIGCSNIKKVFVGVYTANGTRGINDELKKNVNTLQALRRGLSVNKTEKNYLEVYYYDAETANVWGNRVKSDAKVPALEM